jgi:hypothetical protein
MHVKLKNSNVMLFALKLEPECIVPLRTRLSVCSKCEAGRRIFHCFLISFSFEMLISACLIKIC